MGTKLVTLNEHTLVRLYEATVAWLIAHNEFPTAEGVKAFLRSHGYDDIQMGHVNAYLVLHSAEINAALAQANFNDAAFASAEMAQAYDKAELKASLCADALVEANRHLRKS